VRKSKGEGYGFFLLLMMMMMMMTLFRFNLSFLSCTLTSSLCCVERTSHVEMYGTLVEGFCGDIGCFVTWCVPARDVRFEYGVDGRDWSRSGFAE
jgi:hypothetical protein